MIDVDIWVRGTQHATTHKIASLGPEAGWTDGDVKALLTEMLLTLERQKNPGGDPPPVTLRGFSWIVSPEAGGVLVHLELQSGTASAGPFAITEAKLSDMITRVLTGPVPQSSLVH
jgi:hypothetical protein